MLKVSLIANAVLTKPIFSTMNSEIGNERWFITILQLGIYSEDLCFLDLSVTDNYFSLQRRLVIESKGRHGVWGRLWDTWRKDSAINVS